MGVFPCRGLVAPCQRAPGSIEECRVSVNHGGTLNLLFALTRDEFGRDPDCVMATAAGIYGKVKYCPPILPPCQSDWLPDDRGNRTLVFIW